MHAEREQHGDRKFIHIDMDCFFAAIEMRDNPYLHNIPIAIGGSVESRGGGVHSETDRSVGYRN